MIPVITSNNICNNHPSNPHSHPFPTFSTSKKSTCSNFWDATTSNQARRLRDVMTSLQDGLQNCRSFNAGEALFAPGRKKRTLSHIDVLQKKQNNPTHPKILDLRDRYIERHRRWISLRFDLKKASAVVFQDTALPQLSKSATDLYSKPVHSYKFSIFHFSRVPGGVYVIWEEGISQFTIQIKIEVLHF